MQDGSDTVSLIRTMKTPVRHLPVLEDRESLARCSRRTRRCTWPGPHVGFPRFIAFRAAPAGELGRYPATGNFMDIMDMKDLIQVAGVKDQAEADLLVNAGVRYLGFPLRLPVHHADLSEPEAATIIRNLRPPTRAVLITYLNQAGEIVEFCHSLGVSIVQLHGEIDASELRRIKERQPGLAIIKSLVIGLHPMERLLDRVQRTVLYVDAYITDTFDPKTGACGATGKTHDWRVSRQLVRHSPRPVILAGGLTPENVRAAILAVRPAGVDAHTGLEDVSGRKSREKVAPFVSEAQEAFRVIREVTG